MFCRNCGAQIDDNVVICPKCGVSQVQILQKKTPPDKGGFGWGLLGFCIPIVGLILFIVWKDLKPLTAKAAGIGALISVIILLLFGLL